MQATQPTVEHWLPVVGHEDRYEVSDQGRVKRLRRIAHNGVGKHVLQEAITEGSAAGHFYRRTTLSNNGLKKICYVHHLVAEAFIGPRPKGMEVCHGNGDAMDNRVENLRYDTPSANRYDTVRHGRNPSTLKTHCPQGHAYTDDNTAVWSGRRNCRTCHQIANRARKRRLRDERRKARVAA